MVDGKTVAGFVLLVMGGLSVVRPDILITFRVWMAKNIYGADVRPSRKMARVQRMMGVFIFLLGLLVVVDIF